MSMNGTNVSLKGSAGSEVVLSNESCFPVARYCKVGMFKDVKNVGYKIIFFKVQKNT